MACGELITRLLQTYKHPEHGYRSCLGLLNLSRRYGEARLEAACERALVRLEAWDGSTVIRLASVSDVSWSRASGEWRVDFVGHR